VSDESIRFEDAMAAQHAELEADRNLWKKLAHDGGVLVAALRARIAELEAEDKFKLELLTKADARIAELKEAHKIHLDALVREAERRDARVAKLEAVLRRGRQIRIGLPGDTQTVRQTDFHAYMRDIDATLEEKP
jgi:hypothetical protein